ncbi:MAG: CBS domain-containing protein [Phycisphaerae bacterium]
MRMVRDIMSSHVCTLHLDDSVRAAKALFQKKRFHHVLILQHGKAVGVLSDRDVLKAISPFAGHALMERPQDAGTLKKRIHQIMTRRLVSIGPEASLAKAAELMLTEHVSCLPVTDAEGQLLGIVTIRDLMTWAFEVAAVAEAPTARAAASGAASSQECPSSSVP